MKNDFTITVRLYDHAEKIRVSQDSILRDVIDLFLRIGGFRGRPEDYVCFSNGIDLVLHVNLLSQELRDVYGFRMFFPVFDEGSIIDIRPRCRMMVYLNEPSTVNRINPSEN